MAVHVWQTLGGRVGAQAGAGLWVGASFLFPALSVWRDDSVALGMVLFVLETVLASVLLVARITLARRAVPADLEASARLHKALRLIMEMALPFSLVPGVLLLGFAILDAQDGRVALDVAGHVARAGWMALMLVASAALDSVLAPVRTVAWLESAAAWQASRTSVLVIAFLLGTPFMLRDQEFSGVLLGVVRPPAVRRRERDAVGRARSPAPALPRPGHGAAHPMTTNACPGGRPRVHASACAIVDIR